MVFHQGENETIACKEFINIHFDVIRQVSFIVSLNSFISSSESVLSKSAYLPSVIIGNLDTEDTSHIVFRMNSVSKPDVDFQWLNFAIHSKTFFLFTGHDLLRFWWNFQNFGNRWGRLFVEDFSSRKLWTLLCCGALSERSEEKVFYFLDHHQSFDEFSVD